MTLYFFHTFCFSRNFIKIKVFVRKRRCYDREYSNKLQEASDSILPILLKNIRDERTYKTNKEAEKKKRASDKSFLRQPNRYFMFLRLSIAAPFPERFLVAGYFRDLVFQ